MPANGRKIKSPKFPIGAPVQSKGLTPLGQVNILLDSHDAEMLSWEDAKNRYGVYAVLDEDARSGVSYIHARVTH
jgi:hypothetical protein